MPTREPPIAHFEVSMMVFPLNPQFNITWNIVLQQRGWNGRDRQVGSFRPLENIQWTIIFPIITCIVSHPQKAYLSQKYTCTLTKSAIYHDNLFL